MIYSLRRGSNTPTVDDLHLYELGWETTNKRLYINDDAGIKRINTIVKLNGLFNNDPEFYAPTYVMANRVLKSKASWTIGSDPFEYVSIDDTVTEDSTNLITSGAVSSALTTLQSTINEALNNKSEIGHIHEIEDVTNLRTELDEKLPASLDTPIAELENQTLREVFEGGNLVVNGDFSNGTTNWLPAGINQFTVTNGIASVLVNTQTGYIGQNISVMNGNKYYSMAKIKSTTDKVEILGTPTNIKAIANNNFTIISGFYTADITGNRLVYIRDIRPSSFDTFYIDYIYFINTTSLGISSLTVERMDYWFSAFKTLKDIESIEGNVFVSNTDPGTPPRADSLWFHI